MVTQAAHIGAAAGSASRKRAIRVFVGVVAYLLLVRYAYEHFLVASFSYLGYGLRDVAWVDYLLTLMFAGALALLLPARIDRPSDFMLWATFLFVSAPTMLAAHVTAFLDPSEALRFTLAVGLCTALATLLVRHGPIFDLTVRAHPRVAIVVLTLISTATFGYLAATTGLSIRLTGLTDVQSLRLQYRHQAAGSVIGYLIPAQAYVVNPAIMAWGLYRRSPLAFPLGVFAQLVLYSVGGHRMAILSPIAVLALYLAFRHRRDLRGVQMVYGLVALVGAHVALASFGLASQFGLMVQRLVILPPALAVATVEFFREREKAYWAYSFLSQIIDYHYSTTPNFLVGAWLGSATSSANSNFIADGFSNLGYAGMLIEVLVFVALLWLLDAAMKGLPMPVVCSILVLPAIAFANVSAFTVILSQGVGLAILIGALLPREGWHVHGVGPRTGGS